MTLFGKIAVFFVNLSWACKQPNKGDEVVIPHQFVGFCFASNVWFIHSGDADILSSWFLLGIGVLIVNLTLWSSDSGKMEFEFHQWSESKFKHIAAISVQTHLFSYYFFNKETKARGYVKTRCLVDCLHSPVGTPSCHVKYWIEKKSFHDDVIKWKHFSRYWPFVRGVHRWPVNSPHKGQWHGSVMLYLIY